MGGHEGKRYTETLLEIFPTRKMVLDICGGYILSLKSKFFIF